MKLRKNYWKSARLTDMSNAEWEALCDGCGKCCLLKLEDIDDGTVEYTNVACRLLDSVSCRCTRYGSRRDFIEDCIELTPGNLSDLHWLPSTCAYRLVGEGKDLPWWHHLISGSRETIHVAGQSVRGKTTTETNAADLEDHIVQWPR